MAGVVTSWPAAAQTMGAGAPPLPRADASGLLGWLGHHQSDTGDTGDDWNNRLYAAAQAGYYWTEHLKTEVEVGITSEGSSWVSMLTDGRSASGFPAYTFETREYKDTRLSLGQTWQFLHNRWVHPFVTGGVHFDHSHLRREIQFQSDPLIPPTERLVEEDRWRTKPFLGTGLKMYFTPRAFTRMDLLVASGSGGQHLVWRIGFGKDF